MMKKSIIAFVFVLMLIQVKAQDITIDFSDQKQIIRGFGGMNFPAWIGDLNQDMREKAFSNNPGEIGLSILRIQVPPDATQFYREVETAVYARSQGATLFASPWNPPSDMREFLQETDNGTDYYLPSEHYPDYVDHLNSFVSYMEGEEVPLYAISVQNEPDWHGWTTWTPQQLLTFMKQNAKDINCRVIAPESLQYRRSTTDPLLKDEEANAEMDIVGTHLYGTREADFYYPLVYEKNKEIWMTEHLWGSASPEINNWDMALDIAHEINLCMDARMSAFVYWYIRRFYGLIDESGNITDKGYVMSQFSKFIRPGFHRVASTFKPASGVTATAYSSESEMVIVVVNRNNSATDLNLVLQNNTMDAETLTQFTTSEEKKLVNDGTVAITGGSISIHIDANSIATFTSDPTKGGRNGNVAPVAYRGEQVIIDLPDTLGTGQVQIVLAGSESSDADGEIVKYSWAKDGEQISTEADLDLTLPIGSHKYILTVTDNDGAVASSTITVNVSNDKTEEIWLEAECAAVGENWDVIEDDAASNGVYLTVKAGVQSTGEASANTDDHLVYNFEVVEGGTYKIWGHVLAPSYDDDSFWTKVDDGSWTMWNGLASNSGWAWNDIDDGGGVGMLYELEPGAHTLSFSFREDGAGIDKFYITNTGTVPEGLGADATNCVEDTTSAVNDIYLDDAIIIYPNPAVSQFCVQSERGFHALQLIDVNGRVVLEKQYEAVVYNDDINVDVDNGLYILKLKVEGRTAFTKIVINR